MAAEPKLSEIKVSYSYGIKANLGQGTYESADVHLSKAETWQVEGMTADEAGLLWGQRYEALKEEIDSLVEAEYANVSCFAPKPE
jgi:hypothetical protein